MDLVLEYVEKDFPEGDYLCEIQWPEGGKDFMIFGYFDGWQSYDDELEDVGGMVLRAWRLPD